MPWTVRAATTDDTPAIVDVFNAFLPPAERSTVETFRFEDGMRQTDEAFTRLVALTKDAIVEVGQAQNSHTRPRQRFTLSVAVHPERRDYRETYQRFEMELDVSAFEWARFEGWRDRLGGLRRTPLDPTGLHPL